jgi:phosphoribosylformylglycinamidine cyclo-ligase
MCVNDIVCAGAKPLFFLDYIACGKNSPARVEAIVSGVAEGCVQAGCALVGGETAEMPGFYPENEYDLAGFSVGMAEKSQIITGEGMKAGDVLIGLASSGPHSNGFSLIRRAFDLDNDPEKLNGHFDGLSGTLGEALLAPTKIYVKPALALIAAVPVLGIAHITGGGFYENLPRMLKNGLSVKVDKNVIPANPVFDLIARAGDIPERDMYNTFNMGVGMAAVVHAEDAEKALSILKEAGENAFVLGEIILSEAGREGEVLL